MADLDDYLTCGLILKVGAFTASTQSNWRLMIIGAALRLRYPGRVWMDFI